MVPFHVKRMKVNLDISKLSVHCVALKAPHPTPGVGNVDPGGPVSLQIFAPTLVKHT